MVIDYWIVLVFGILNCFRIVKAFQIFVGKNDKILLVTKCIWDIIWFQASKSFQDIYKTGDGE